MRLLFVILMAAACNGCTHMGNFATGFSEGYRPPVRQTVNCTTTHNQFTSYTNCN